MYKKEQLKFTKNVNNYAVFHHQNILEWLAMGCSASTASKDYSY